jgi:hypothetical protein
LTELARQFALCGLNGRLRLRRTLRHGERLLGMRHFLCGRLLNFVPELLKLLACDGVLQALLMSAGA